MKKKGLSQMVSTLLLILMSVAMVAGVWAVINTFVNSKLDSTKACYGLFEKIKINDAYTCYNYSGNYTKILIEVGEIDLNSLLISVEQGGNNVVYTLTNKSEIIPGIKFYKSENEEVKIPGKESGKTYIINSTNKPEKIEIAPKIENTICDVVDYSDNLPNCI